MDPPRNNMVAHRNKITIQKRIQVANKGRRTLILD